MQRERLTNGLALYINLRWLVLGSLGLLWLVGRLAFAWVFQAFPRAPLAGLILAGGVINGGYVLWYRRGRGLPQLAIVQILLDVVALSWFVYWTGGIESPLTFAYGMVILTAGVLLGRRQSFLAAGFCFAAFLVPLGLEGMGALPAIHSADLYRHFGPTRRSLGQLLAGAGLNLFLVGGFAGLSAYLVGALEQWQQRVLAAEQDREQVHRQFAEKVVRAQEEERSRIARQLHDQTGQMLSVLIMRLEMLEQRPAASHEAVAALRQLAEQTLDGIHRLGFDLRPSLLDDLGLVAAIRAYCEANAGAAGVESRVTPADDWPRLPSDTETALYRWVQEAVMNVVRHARARHLQVKLVRLAAAGGSATLRVEVVDDGCGFAVEPVWPARAPSGRAALGLMGMEERARLLGGEMEIRSAPGQGCRVAITFPQPSPERPGQREQPGAE